MRKCFKILTLIFLVTMFYIPYTFSKYSTIITNKIIINTRQPEYTIRFLPNTLPNEYQEVEYIEADGTQWINTELTMNGNYTFYADGYVSEDNLGVLISGYSDNKNRQGVIFYTNSNKYGYYWFGRGYIENTDLTSIGIQLKERFQYIQNKNGITLKQGSLSVSNTYNGELTLFDTNILLFDATNKVNDNYGILYNAKIYDGEELIKNYVPCYRKSDNTIGLYDTIDNIFYTNSGTGTFIKGNDISFEPGIIEQVFIYNKSQKLLENTFIRNGYRFAGWNDDPNGLGNSYANKQDIYNLSDIDGDEITLYAQWVAQ